MISRELKMMVGQMLMAGFPGPSGDDPKDGAGKVPEQAQRLLNEYYVGNYIYFARNIQSARQCTELSRALSDLVFDRLGVCPIITTDQEGGIVSRLVEGAALTPGAAAVGAAVKGLSAKLLESERTLVDGDQTKALKRIGKAQERAMNAPLLKVRALGHMSGEILKACGINTDLAPDMDVNIEPANPIIGSRSYGDNAALVSKVAIAQMQGLSEGGVLPMIKHFPGHGNVKSDSHLGIPVNDTPEEKLREEEFSTFRAAVQQGAQAIMTAHVRYLSVDPENPATLSRKIMTDMLRDEWGFTGIVATDCLEMDAIKAAYGCGEGAVRAIEAGVDLLTISHTYAAAKEAAEAIYAALESGRLSPERIRLSYERIRRIKQMYGLTERQRLNPVFSEELVQSRSRQIISEELMKDAITLLKGDLKVDLKAGSGAAADYIVIAFDQAPSSGAEDMRPLSFADQMAVRYGCPAIPLPLNATDEQVEEGLKRLDAFLTQAEEHRGTAISPVPVILGLYNARFRAGQQKLIQALRELAQNGRIRLAVILLGAPYDLPLVEDADCVLTSYEYTRLSVKALLEAMESGTYPGQSPFAL